MPSLQKLLQVIYDRDKLSNGPVKMMAMASSPWIQETTARRKVTEKFGEIRKFDYRSENCIMSKEKSLDFRKY